MNDGKAQLILSRNFFCMKKYVSLMIQNSKTKKEKLKGKKCSFKILQIKYLKTQPNQNYTRKQKTKKKKIKNEMKEKSGRSLNVSIIC